MTTLREAARWREAGTGFGRAIVVRTDPRSPLGVGSTLLASDDGRIAGGVSAGCSDGEVVDAVLAARTARRREVIRIGSDKSGEGYCTGSIDVLIDPDPPAISATGITITVVPGPPEAPLSSRMSLEDGRLTGGTLGSPALDAELVARLAQLARDEPVAVVDIGLQRLLVERDARPRLVVVGAGDIGVHLAQLAADVGYQVVVIDARAAFATRDRFPEADKVLVGWTDELADEAGVDADSSVAAIAHDPKQDDPAITVALKRGARYVGALGSRRAHAARLVRLAPAGLAPDDLARIHAPIGLDLGATGSAEIAVSILAEVILERRRGTQPTHSEGGR